MPGPVSYPALPITGGVVNGRTAIGVPTIPAGTGAVAQLYVGGPGADFGQVHAFDTQHDDAGAIAGYMWGAGLTTVVDQRWGGVGKWVSTDSDTYLFACVGGLTFCTGALRNTSGPSEAIIPYVRANLDNAGRFSLSNATQGFPAGARLSVWNTTAGETILRLRNVLAPSAGDPFMRMETFAGLGLASWTHALAGPELNFHNPSDGAIDFKLSRTAAGILTITAPTVTLSGATGLRVNQIQGQTANDNVAFLCGVAFPIASVAVDFTLDKSYRTVLSDATSGARVVTLPSAASSFANGSGRVYTVIKKDSSGNSVTLGGTVSGVTNRTLTAQYQFITVQSDGTSWYQVG